MHRDSLNAGGDIATGIGDFVGANDSLGTGQAVGYIGQPTGNRSGVTVVGARNQRAVLRRDIARAFHRNIARTAGDDRWRCIDYCNGLAAGGLVATGIGGGPGPGYGLFQCADTRCLVLDKVKRNTVTN